MRGMIKTVWLPAIVIAAVAGPPAVAQEGQTVSNDATEIVCRRLAPPTGTRLGPRNVCKTQEQWDAEQAQYREEVQRQQDRSHHTSFGG